MLNLALFGLAITVLLARLYFAVKFSHWKRLGVVGPNPTFLTGNLRDVSGHIFQMISHHYNLFKHRTPLHGIYLLQQPIAVITDLHLIKSILITDFQNFDNRGLYSNERDDPLSATLFTVDGEIWRKMRTKLTPTFTSAKMKFMFPTILAVADKFDACLAKKLDGKQRELEIKDLLARFGTDVIGTCAFGIECKSLEDPTTEFRRMGELIFSEPRQSNWLYCLISSFKNICRWLRVKVVRDDVSKFFLSVVKETVAYRERHGVQKNDFMDLLIKMKNDAGSSWTVEKLAAQAFIFFMAGFETSSTVLMFMLYELALNPDIQNRARKEIQEVLSVHDGEFSYDSMAELVYLDKIIKETLRKYPPVCGLFRKSNKSYKISNTNIFLPEDTFYHIPVYAIQNDPEIYPNPESFDPDRDTPINAMSFLPFGSGPRNCIGERFGWMQMRVAMVTLLMGYEFSVSPRTQVPMVFDKHSMILSPPNGMWLNVSRL